MATHTVRARTLWILLACVFAAGSVLMIALLTRVEPGPGSRPALRPLSPDMTATAAYAGAIPSADQSPLARPLGLDGDGERLYVALADASAVGVFTYDGAREETVPVAAAEGAAGSTPVDVAVLSDGRLAVVDTAGERVLIVDPDDPKARGEEFTGGPGRGRILSPTAVDAAAGKIYVADGSDGSVREYAESGALLRTMAFETPEPTYIGGLFADTETLWVSDSNSDRVIAVDLGTGVQRSVLPGEFGLPRGVAVTGIGDIMVAETFARQVSVFDPTGSTLIDEFPDTSTEGVDEAGLLRAPESIVWDEGNSRLYVTDAIDGRIKVYNYRGAGSR